MIRRDGSTLNSRTIPESSEVASLGLSSFALVGLSEVVPDLLAGSSSRSADGSVDTRSSPTSADTPRVGRRVGRVGRSGQLSGCVRALSKSSPVAARTRSITSSVATVADHGLSGDPGSPADTR